MTEYDVAIDVIDEVNSQQKICTLLSMRRRREVDNFTQCIGVECMFWVRVGKQGDMGHGVCGLVNPGWLHNGGI